MDGCDGVLLQFGVDLVKVSLGGDDNCGVALFSREELQVFLLVLEGLQALGRGARLSGILSVLHYKLCFISFVFSLFVLP